MIKLSYWQIRELILKNTAKINLMKEIYVPIVEKMFYKPNINTNKCEVIKFYEIANNYKSKFFFFVLKNTLKIWLMKTNCSLIIEKIIFS